MRGDVFMQNVVHDNFISKFLFCFKLNEQTQKTNYEDVLKLEFFLISVNESLTFITKPINCLRFD